MGQYAVAGARNVGLKRDNNEDFHAETVIERDGRRFSLWVVADGMGGGARGEVASQLAVETVLEVMGSADLADPRRDLDTAFKTANARVHAEGTGGGVATRSVMGTTLVAALVDEATNSAWIANVGDSRAYLVDGGPIVRITKDHSLVAERVEAGIITEDEARQEENRNVITRAIGVDPVVTVDVFGPSELAPGERLVLCSDGLHGMVDDATIAAIVGQAPFGQAVEQLIQAALAAGGNDNVAVIVGGLDEGDAGITLVGSRPHTWAPAPAAAARKVPPGTVVPLLAIAGVVAVLAMVLAVRLWPGGDEKVQAGADQTVGASATAKTGESPSATGVPTRTPTGWGPQGELWPRSIRVIAGDICGRIAEHVGVANGQDVAFIDELRSRNGIKGAANSDDNCPLSVGDRLCLPVTPRLYELGRPEGVRVEVSPPGTCGVPTVMQPLPTAPPARPTIGIVPTVDPGLNSEESPEPSASAAPSASPKPSASAVPSTSPEPSAEPSATTEPTASPEPSAYPSASVEPNASPGVGFRPAPTTGLEASAPGRWDGMSASVTVE